MGKGHRVAGHSCKQKALDLGMNTSRSLAFLCLGFFVVAGSMTLQSVGPRAFEVDGNTSHIVIEVGKTGALSLFAGHTHEVAAPIRGVVHLDSQDPSHSDVHLEIDAAALNVTDKGDPPADVPKVQQVMVSNQVLDVGRYPTILFQSTNVAIKVQTATTLNLTVTGQLTLHNVTRSVTVPVSGQLGGSELTATGRFLLNQTDYGIKPVSVGGVVAVKDALTISFTVIARERSGA
jgi:polyisoprenoid-binding protein YceI